jgi:hypothetical protein
MVYAITDNKERELCVVSQPTLKVQRTSEATDGTTGEVTHLVTSTNPTAATGKSRLRFFSIPSLPDATETIQLYIINPQNALSADSTELLVPSDPVIQLAYLYCLYERGEELGEMLTLTSNKAEAALADAIMYDSSMTSEIVFTAP